jgi:hypothetical protein
VVSDHVDPARSDSPLSRLRLLLLSMQSDSGTLAPRGGERHDARIRSGIRASHKPAAEKDCDRPEAAPPSAMSMTATVGSLCRVGLRGARGVPNRRETLRHRRHRDGITRTTTTGFAGISWRRIARDDSLKIMGSPVRVRVSPSGSPAESTGNDADPVACADSLTVTGHRRGSWCRWFEPGPFGRKDRCPDGAACEGRPHRHAVEERLRPARRSSCEAVA